MLVIALAACGGGGSSAPPQTISGQVKERLAADAVVLQASDLPGTWTTNRDPTVAASDQNRDKVSEAADACFPLDAAGIVASATREYLSGPTLGHIIVRGVVEAHADPAAITGKLSSVSASDAAKCLQQYVAKVFSGDPATTVHEITINPSTVKGVGDEQGGFLVSMPVSSTNGTDFTVGADIVFARVGRFRAVLTVINFDTTPDHALATAGLKSMVLRASQQ